MKIWGARPGVPQGRRHRVDQARQQERRSGDSLGAIKLIADLPSYDFSTAEGRADFDDWLREQIQFFGGDDEILKRHLGMMAQEWRRELFS